MSDLTPEEELAQWDDGDEHPVEHVIPFDREAVLGDPALAELAAGPARGFLLALGAVVETYGPPLELVARPARS